MGQKRKPVEEFYQLPPTEEPTESYELDTPAENSGDVIYSKHRIEAESPYNQEEVLQSDMMDEVQDEKNGGVWNDIKKGIKKSPLMIVGGLADMAEEIADVTHMNDIAEYVETRMFPDSVRKLSEKMRGGPIDKDNLFVDIDPELADAGVTGQVIKSGSQFMVPFLSWLGPAAKGTKAIGILKNSPKLKAFFDASVTGFAVDAGAFDPDEGNVSDVVGRVFQDNRAAQLLDEYLGTDPDDSEAFKRFKNGLNGLILGGAFEGVFKVGGKVGGVIADHIKAFRKSKAFTARAAKIHKLEKAAGLDGDAALAKEIKKLDDATPVPEKAKGKPDAKEGDKAAPKLSEEDQLANTVIAKERAAGDATAAGHSWKWEAGRKIAKEFEDVATSRAKPMVKVDKKVVRKIAKTLMSSKGKGFTRSLNVDLSKGVRTNIDKIGGTKELKEIVGLIEKEYGDFLADVPMSDDMLERLARETGSSIQDVNLLSESTKNLAVKLKAQELLRIDLADQTLNWLQRMGDNASPEDIIELYRRIELTSAIGVQTKNAETEIARALASLRRVREPGQSSLAKMDALANILGGRRNNTLLAKRIIRLANEEGVDALQIMKELERFATRSKWGKTKDAFFEMYVNGLLSRPVTQVVNTMGNLSTIAMSIAERSIAEGMSRATGKSLTGGVARGETKAMLHGFMKGQRRGWKMFAKAWRTGRPSEGFKTDMYKPGHHAISANALGLDNTGWNSTGFWVDHLGAITRAPGKFLMSADELFKSINKDMERHALAYRKMAGTDLEGKAYLKQYAKHLNSEDIVDQADVFAKYQTFTNELERGSTASNIQNILSGDNAAGFVGKMFVPFFRTPVNIIHFAGHRAPVTSLFYKSIRQQLTKGTAAQKQLVLAKMATGTAAMSTAMYFAHGGLITGAAPTNPIERDGIMGSGWRPYSVVTPWGYMPYNRFDPLGILLGTAADLYQAGATIEDAYSAFPDGEKESAIAWQKYGEAAQIGLLSVFNQLKDRHYMAGLANMFDVIDGEPGAWDKALAQQFKGMMPPFSFYSSLTKGITQTIDPVIRDKNSDDVVNEFYNVINKDIPNIIVEGSTGLYPKRDILGKPKLHMGGEFNMAWRSFNMLFNPAKMSKKSDSLLKTSMAAYGVNMAEPWRKRSISTGVEGDPSVPISEEARDYYGVEFGRRNKELEQAMRGSDYRSLKTEADKKAFIEAGLESNAKKALNMTRLKFQAEIQEATEKVKKLELVEAGGNPNVVNSAVPRNTLPLIPN